MKVDPKQFRIGNIVIDAVSKEPMIIDELGENVSAIIINREKYPLPNGWYMAYALLTEEWLLKFGIETDFLQWSIQKHVDGYLIYRGHGCIHVVIKYVHQLQNLYFALTGKELEVR